MIYFVYILKCSDEKYYTGLTKNINNRIHQHINGEVTSTKHRRPLKLIYFEACLDQKDALKREKYFKTHYGKMFLKSLPECKITSDIEEIDKFFSKIKLHTVFT